MPPRVWAASLACRGGHLQGRHIQQDLNHEKLAMSRSDRGVFQKTACTKDLGQEEELGVRENQK